MWCDVTPAQVLPRISVLYQWIKYLPNLCNHKMCFVSFVFMPEAHHSIQRIHGVQNGNFEIGPEFVWQKKFEI